MKKLVTAFALCAAMSAMAVDSDNVVGYQSVTLAADVYQMIGVQFNLTGSTDTGIALNDLVKGTIPYNTTIQMLQSNGKGYDFYTYLAEAYDPITETFVPGWADGGSELASLPVPTGSAFWLVAPSACTVTIAGQVYDTNKQLSATGGQFSMIANPFPIPVNLNSLTWTGLTYNDTVQVLQSNGKGYDFYTYLEEAYDPITETFVPGWADGGSELMSIAIPVGQGFWISPAASVTATFTAPVL